ncbi:MAG: hypothetical protein O2856_00770 [Planctomycetota bacterium]|nr:hypothetical protein [Planctomycetota bacterium]
MVTHKKWNCWQRSILASLIAIFSLLASDILRACPFCLSPPLTLVEEIGSSDMVVIVELLQFKVIRSGGTAIPQSTVRIREFLQGADLAAKCGRLQAGQAIVVPQDFGGERGELFLLFGSLPASDSSSQTTFAANTEQTQSATETGSIVTADLKIFELTPKKIQRTSLLIPEQISWISTTPVSREAIQYIKHAPLLTLSSSQRLPYYIAYLEHSDPLLSIDAWAEFANATYDDVKAVRHDFPREKLRQWIEDPLMSPERLGLYGMMLGLCGNSEDAEFLKEQIGTVPPTGKDNTPFFRYGTDGLMGGYLLLTGEEGVAFLEQTRLKPGAPTDSAHAAVEAMKFVYSYESRFISQSRLKAAMRQLLSNDDLRILTITNLARWKDWDSWPELEQIFFNTATTDRSTQKAIVQFAEECRKATDTNGTALEVAGVADSFLTQAELEHPELFHSTVNAEFLAP